MPVEPQMVFSRGESLNPSPKWGDPAGGAAPRCSWSIPAGMGGMGRDSHPWAALFGDTGGPWGSSSDSPALIPMETAGSSAWLFSFPPVTHRDSGAAGIPGGMALPIPGKLPFYCVFHVARGGKAADGLGD